MTLPTRDRDPNHLHPDIRPLYDQLIAWATDNALTVKPIAIWGSPEVQDALYAQGRTAPGKIVTFESGNNSKHCFMLNGLPASKAFDLGVFDENGVYCPNGNDSRYTALGTQWEAMALANHGLGLVWGGIWKTLKDCDHFEIA